MGVFGGISWRETRGKHEATRKIAVSPSPKAKRWPSATVGHFEIPCYYESKRILVQNLSYENEPNLYENETVVETHCEKLFCDNRVELIRD